MDNYAMNALHCTSKSFRETERALGSEIYVNGSKVSHGNGFWSGEYLLSNSSVFESNSGWFNNINFIHKFLNKTIICHK